MNWLIFHRESRNRLKIECDSYDIRRHEKGKSQKTLFIAEDLLYALVYEVVNYNSGAIYAGHQLQEPSAPQSAL